MINLILSVISSICFFIIMIQMIDVNIPLGLKKYYKDYSYNALGIDFIRITIVLLIVVIIFKIFKVTMFLMIIFILLSVLFGVDILLINFLKLAKDSNLAQDLIKNAGEFGSKIIFQDVIIMIFSIIISILYNTIGTPFSIIISLILAGITIFQLK